MPPKGKIDRLIIFYDPLHLRFFCEATDIRGAMYHEGKRLWVIPMKMNSLGDVIEFDHGCLGNFIIEVMNDLSIPAESVTRFLNENFHGAIHQVKFEKISPEHFSI